MPRDFDISPYFQVVKPTIEHGFDYTALHWADKPRLPPAEVAGSWDPFQEPGDAPPLVPSQIDEEAAFSEEAEELIADRADDLRREAVD